MFNTNSVFEGNDEIFKSRKTAKALAVLSEDAILGDINTCFSCGYETVDEEPFILSFSYLSEQPVTRNQTLVSCREFRSHSAHATNEDGYMAVRGCKTNITCFTYSHNYTIQSYGQKYRFSSATYEGNNIWHDQTHFDVSWSEQKNNLGKIV